MSRAKRLSLVLDIAERAENKAAEAFEMARRLLQEDQDKLADLQRYYADYEQSFSQPTLLRAQDIMQQRSFLQRLAEAVRQQEQIVERRGSIAESKQKDWRTAHLKRRALQELIERVRADEQKVLTRKEQKMLDEWFSQSALRRAENGRS